jgi:hypothetical protein
LGYKTIVVFYRRFIEAWVSQVNLEATPGTPCWCSSRCGSARGWLRHDRYPIADVCALPGVLVLTRDI